MPPNTMSAAQFEDLQTIRNAEGLIAVITRKVTTGHLSIGIFKEFERNGVTERSSFFQPRQFAQVHELLTLAEEWVRDFTKLHPPGELERRARPERR